PSDRSLSLEPTSDSGASSPFPVGSRLRWSALVCLSIYTVLLLIDAIQIGDRIYHGELSFRLIRTTWKSIFGIR
ncbi:MAG: hypothetical protein R3F11_31865, partial [Verrucomicrobiales bacterium]